ncbi:MAG: hypothetical protein RB191_08330, partial [Terriglobia bacterium]|nr:hypothetical protein [Terriglobia bacterium]
TAASLFTAAILMWTRGVKYAPVLTTFLMCVLLANCEVVFGTENAGGIAVNLCVIAVWCFLQERFIAWGVVCLAMSLVIKPHDAGFVWLFFLLAGESYRKRAMQTLIVAVILSLPSIVWVSHVSPHWIQELHANLANFSARGDLNDPGPTAVSGRTGNMIISLQAVFSVLWDEPSFYNPATYLVCAPLFLLWARRVSRTRLSADGAWLAIAAVVPLTMLVTYHRTYDAKLIMLTVPACAMLFAKGDRIAQWAFAFTTAGIFFSADIPLGMVLAFSGKLHLKPAGFIEKALFILLYRPVPLLLLAMAAFYLWVFLRHAPKQSASMGAETGGAIPDLPAQA